MRVNSASTGFFANRPVLRSGISMALLGILLIASSFAKHSDRDLWAKQVNLLIRQTGHRLLWQAGDSSSRVLPVTEVKEGTFQLRFENELAFNHDSLIALSQSLLPKSQFPSGYTVTVHDCMKGSIVYGFQVNNTSPDILACMGRSEPQGCYTIEFAFPDFYKNIKQQKTDIDQMAASVNADTRHVDPNLEELNTPTSGNDISQQAEKLKSFEVNSREDNRILEEFKTTIFGYSLTNVVYAGILMLLSVTLLIGRFAKFLKPSPGRNQNQAIVKKSVPELAALGKFVFNVKGQHLLLESEVVSLTDKECKVLHLLHKNFGELIPRETLMQEVWINEGVITGRSLDMFVSKLRKKLSRDPGLRITNVHGKGYKLEIPENRLFKI